jgi:hypothetical protein
MFYKHFVITVIMYTKTCFKLLHTVLKSLLSCLYDMLSHFQFMGPKSRYSTNWPNFLRKKKFHVLVRQLRQRDRWTVIVEMDLNASMVAKVRLMVVVGGGGRGQFAASDCTRPFRFNFHMFITIQC